MKKKGQLKTTLPQIQQLEEEQDEFEYHQSPKITNSYSTQQAKRLHFKASKFGQMQETAQLHRPFDDEVGDDDDDDDNSNLSTLPDITTPSGRMQCLSTSEVAQYYSYTQRASSNNSVHKADKLSPKLIKYQSQTRVQGILINEDRQCLNRNQIFQIIAILTLCLAVFFVIVMYIAPPPISSFSVQQRDNNGRQSNLNLVTGKMDQSFKGFNKENTVKPRNKIQYSLSLIKKLIPKIIRSEIDDDIQRDNVDNDDDNGDNAFVKKENKKGGVLAPFYFETVTSSEKQVTQILHRQTREKRLNQDDLHSNCTILIYFMIFVMFPLYCNSFYLYRKMILMADIIKQRKIQEEMEKLKKKHSMIKDETSTMIQNQNVAIAYNRVHIKKKPKKIQFSKNSKQNNLSKERLEYQQTMEHIEREAHVGQILLSKSEDVTRRVKMLNLNNHRSKSLKNKKTQPQKQTTSSDEALSREKKSQSFSLIVGVANIISLAQSDTESFSLIYLLILIAKFFSSGVSPQGRFGTLFSKAKKLVNIGFCISNIMMALYHVNSIFFFNSYF